ncbi:hypothetical protein PISMIDRAFT_14248 [Pisolithus microcarpus 441]|uniref:Uncharacterized protein n=1 Tax=Pisolithus microcarpus 441 TaxID=765257 RepID=A0A0C9Y1P6_9AGAM|nr:hypothetical protein PISMIDRAFT_14248 [Pisolithus microcarpus 441]
MSPSSPPGCDYSVPPSIHRAEARWGLAKRAREDHNLNGYVGCHKCARVKQPIDPKQIEDNSGIQTDTNEMASSNENEGDQGSPNPQVDEDPVDPIDDNEHLSLSPSLPHSPPPDVTDPRPSPPPPGCINQVP